MSSRRPIRLPPVRVLRVRNPNKEETNPCLFAMTSVLSCWASAGSRTAGCAAVEQALRACMDGPKPPPPKHNAINHHLSRFQDRITGHTGPKSKKK